MNPGASVPLNPYRHEPVMLPQVMRFLAVRPGDVVADVTAGGGGHLRALARSVGAGGRVLALDRDPRALQQDAAGGVAREFADRVILRHAAFAELPALLRVEKLPKLDGLLCDLGVSSPQLDCPERGFALRQDGPLDMRMDPSRGITAYQWLARCGERELADCLFHYGQERRSRRVARAIVHARPLPDSTRALADLIARAVGGRRGRIHPATRSFQALRMVVNDELGQLARLLEALPHVLAPGGRAVFIAFHSLEDGMIKRALREGARRFAVWSLETALACDGSTSQVRRSQSGVKPPRTKGFAPRFPAWELLCRKPRRPEHEEVQCNPRCRSARLRAIRMVERPADF
ncbi:MAG: 16S rRNA (cytosine(1402)-N(4))-methyltransferase RsmH [Myxococcota bacterium]